VLLPVGHLTGSIAVPDAFAGGAAERLVAFKAIGAVVRHLFRCDCDGHGGGRFPKTYDKERNKEVLVVAVK